MAQTTIPAFFFSIPESPKIRKQTSIYRFFKPVSAVGESEPKVDHNTLTNAPLSDRCKKSRPKKAKSSIQKAKDKLYSRNMRTAKEVYHERKKPFPDRDNRTIQNGLLFTATNNYSEYEVMSVMDDEQCWVKENKRPLYIQSREIVATATIDAGSELENIAVNNPAYRNHGIGQALIRFMKKKSGQLHILQRDLSEEGGQLVRACITKGILQDGELMTRCHVSAQSQSSSP